MDNKTQFPTIVFVFPPILFILSLSVHSILCLSNHCFTKSLILSFRLVIVIEDLSAFPSAKNNPMKIPFSSFNSNVSLNNVFFLAA